jgi:probable LLM family oxidoreductase
VIRNVVEQGTLADQVGIDFFGIGEHHRPDYSISSPEMVLSAIAARTKRIRLGSAVTVLSSDDPIRVYQRFSTLDAVSSGRAEVILGRGSFTESFPLFGFDLKDYETLFTEKLDVFLRLIDEEPVTWEGTYRTPLRDQRVYPPTANGLRAWIAIGGSPDSVIRAASSRLPLIMAIIGGSADRFVPLAELYRHACDQLGSGFLPLGVHSPGHIAETDELAREQLWPHYRTLIERLGRERGWAPPSEAHFIAEVEQGAVYCGSPETVAQRIATTVRTLGLQRFEMKYASGPMSHSQLMTSLELYGTQVIPLVREILSDTHK